MQDKILIIDFGSQVTQLIARRVREMNTYCEIHPFNSLPEITDDVIGIILSGSPCSVLQDNAPTVDVDKLSKHAPILGICYGAQLIAHLNKGRVEKSSKREYGRALLDKVISDAPLFNGIDTGSQVWMSHGDSIKEIPDTFNILASTESIPVAAYEYNGTAKEHPVYGVQFHPEVTHSTIGSDLIRNFIVGVCKSTQAWTSDSFIDSTVEKLKAQLGDDHVVLGLSGGVDSSVAAGLIHKAIGDRLHCIFVDNGLLRKNEYEEVLESYKTLGLNVTGVNSSEAFLSELDGCDDPETKRKIIGRVFIEVFDAEAKKIDNAKWLGQGTIYPDVVESANVNGPAHVIKSHHNVGGLPEKMGLKLCEPLNLLFKDEVRRVGTALGIPNEIISRHPFPGPGLAIRVVGLLTRDKVRILQEADDIFIKGLKKNNLYDDVWQAGVMLLPVQSVGVMGDERTYEYVVALRAVSSLDGMTADWCQLPMDFLANISNEIINNVNGVNRVVYDISSKPPATIEWE
jgi:GMP synthase (glutamine-hydrolysing)